MELHYKNSDYYIDVMMRADVPEPSPGLRAEWESMEHADRMAAREEYYQTYTKPMCKEIGIPLSQFGFDHFAGFSFSDVEEYIEFSAFLDLWAKDDRILSISVAIGSMMQSVRATSKCPYDITMADAKNRMGIENDTYSGEGVSIGVLDQYLPDNYNHLGADKYTVYNGNSDVHNHATLVSEIIAGDEGIVPNAHLFFAAADANTLDECVEWLIQQEVSVVNMSMGYRTGTGKYDDYAAYIDYVSRTENILFVISSGNKADDDTTYNVVAPGLSGNSVVVGSSNAQSKVSYFSFYKENSNLQKPDLVACGENIKLTGYFEAHSGTSYAAPFVTGIAAKLVQRSDAIRFNVNFLKAVLLGSCVELSGQDEGHDPIAGAGLVNYENAVEILTNSAYKYGTKGASYAPREIFSQNVEIPSGKSIEIHLSIQLPGEDVEPSPDVYEDLFFSEYEIVLAHINSMGDVTDEDYIVLSWESVDTNTGYLSYTNTGTSTLYAKIKVVLTENNNPNNSEKIAIAVEGYKKHLHTYTSNTTWVPYNATQHRRYCVCMMGYQSQSHTMVYNNILKKNVCSVCGYRAGGTTMEPYDEELPFVPYAKPKNYDIA